MILASRHTLQQVEYLPKNHQKLGLPVGSYSGQVFPGFLQVQFYFKDYKPANSQLVPST